MYPQYIRVPPDEACHVLHKTICTRALPFVDLPTFSTYVRSLQKSERSRVVGFPYRLSINIDNLEMPHVQRLIELWFNADLVKIKIVTYRKTTIDYVILLVKTIVYY